MAESGDRREVASAKAPAAIGPYSQALQANGFVFVSGQIGLDPATGELEAGGFKAQARRVLRNLGAVLEAGGVGFDDVVKVTIYLSDIADFADMNSVYAEYFRDPFPARAVVEVAALPKGAGVEMELVALAPRA